MSVGKAGHAPIQPLQHPPACSCLNAAISKRTRTKDAKDACADACADADADASAGAGASADADADPATSSVNEAGQQGPKSHAGVA